MLKEVLEDFNIVEEDLFNEFQYQVYKEMELIEKLILIKKVLNKKCLKRTIEIEYQLLKNRYDDFILRFIIMDFEIVSREEKLEITKLMSKENTIKYEMLLNLLKERENN